MAIGPPLTLVGSRRDPNTYVHQAIVLQLLGLGLDVLAEVVQRLGTHHIGISVPLSTQLLGASQSIVELHAVAELKLVEATLPLLAGGVSRWLAEGVVHVVQNSTELRDRLPRKHTGALRIMLRDMCER